MAAEGSSSAELEEEFYGAASGWVEARSSCDHLSSLSSDLSHIPPPDSPCSRCHHPAENWVCLSCKDVLCSRFINKHMVGHHQETGHCLALSFRYCCQLPCISDCFQVLVDCFYKGKNLYNK
ncbi:Histone deacetylase family protein [Dioscorea alata]|uniref:Histone deacetylase family protein n=1 Tax=Dioscorea alata TaxID=55571 RepID=A0ACB7TWS8_DIOAL|nr:Histone deacetylase family protein [Dioscorea alata]